MDIERAKELLSALADGVDPLTGEVLDRDNVCNRPEIIRALHMALYELDKREKKTVKKHLPDNAGKPWTEEGEDRLCEMFDSGASRRELCEYFKRTEGAIDARLVRLGKISERKGFEQI